jgi:hypothetical protein
MVGAVNASAGGARSRNLFPIGFSRNSRPEWRNGTIEASCNRPVLGERANQPYDRIWSVIGNVDAIVEPPVSNRPFYLAPAPICSFKMRISLR